MKEGTAMEYEKLTTETVNPESAQLDTLSTLAAAKLMNRMDAGIPEAVEKALPEIAQLADIAADAFMHGGRLIYCGAGTSGRLGVLDASECPPTFGVSPELVVGLIAGGEKAVRSAVENAEDSRELAEEDLKSIDVNKKDVVVSISASGCAPHCIGALDYAESVGAFTACVVCVHGSELSRHSRISIEAVVGPEVLTGSTRLRAGTATKMVLNMITTLSMVKTGKVYKNYMVDMQPTNAKLRDRAVRIIKSAADVSREKAEEALSACSGNMKAAIVCLETGADCETAAATLESSGGFVRKAIEEINADKERNL